MENLTEENALVSEGGNTENLSPGYLAQNPYPGLNSYDEARQEYFMGRDREKQEVLQTLELYSLCFLIGKSGLGKSSLINAAIVPELKRTSHAPIPIRINFDIDGNLTTEVKKDIEEKIKAIDPTAIAFDDMLLWEYFQRVKIFNGYLKPVLIFDQFEEIFTRGQSRQAELNNLMSEIIDLAENKVPEKVQQRFASEGKTVPSNLNRDYKILFALREDYLPQLTSLKNYLPTLKFCTYRLSQMRGPDAFKAVFFPAQKASPPLLNEETAREIIFKLPESFEDELNIASDERPKDDDQFAGKRIEPFLLNLFCFTLNEERKDKELPTITKKDVANKDFGKLVKDYYNKVTGRSWRLSAAIENELITPDGKYRKFASEDAFVNGGRILNTVGKLKDGDVQDLINKKIIRRKRISDINYYELIHDVLIPVVVRKRRLRTIAIRVGIWAISVFLVGFMFFAFYKLELKAQRQSEEKIARANLRAAIEKQREEANTARARAKADADAQEKIARAQANADAQEQIAKAQANAHAQEQIAKAQANAHAQEQIAIAQAETAKAESKADAQEQIQLNNSKNALSLQRQLDSLKALYLSVAFADTSLKVNDSLSKRKFASAAYDSLPKTLRLNDIFVPKVYTAIVALHQNNLKESSLHTNQKREGYKNINGILNFNDRLYFNRPFKSVTDTSGRTLFTDPNLIHSWISPDGSILVAVIANKNETKQLIVRELNKDLGPPKNIRIALLKKNEDVLSLIFDARNKTCVYATRSPAAVYSINLTTLAAPILIKSLQNDQYLLLADRGGYFTAITNRGNYMVWNNYTATEPQTIIKNTSRGDAVTAISSGDLNHKTLFAGCESGDIYKIDASNDVRKFYSPTNISTAITCLTSSTDGKWLAAGFFDGTVKLWRLDAKERVPADIDLANDHRDGVSALAFNTRGEMVASTDYGYVYHFPLSIDALYKLFPTKGSIQSKLK